MFNLEALDFRDKPAAYAQLARQLEALLHGERDFIANCANTTALLWHSLPDLNWAGVYRLVGDELVLGPFQGKPACVRIKPGRGVCGTAAATRRTVLVPNVHEFPGHIVCDSASNSEIVVPLLNRGELLGVLDLDSPKLNRFDAGDAAGLERLAACLAAAQADPGADISIAGAPMQT
jgi:GAF domain-containing protein